MESIKITSVEFDKFSEENDCLSDVDYSYNVLSGEYDRPNIEWDGPYGRRWESFDSEEARTERLQRYQRELNEWVIQYRINEEKRQIEFDKKLAANKAYWRSLQNNLGNLCPQLNQLKFT